MKCSSEDLELLRNHYRNAGYLDVIVDEDKVDIDFHTNKKIHISIDVEGQQYVLGEMKVEDATIYAEAELLGVVEIETGDAFSPEAVDAAAMPCASTSPPVVISKRECVPNTSPVWTHGGLIWSFEYAKAKCYVESIRVEGNTKTKTRVILRELALRPSDVFDDKMNVSERRLRNTQFFEDVRLNAEPTNIPGRRDLSVVVRENTTRSFSLQTGLVRLRVRSFPPRFARATLICLTGVPVFRGTVRSFASARRLVHRVARYRFPLKSPGCLSSASLLVWSCSAPSPVITVATTTNCVPVSSCTCAAACLNWWKVACPTVWRWSKSWMCRATARCPPTPPGQPRAMVSPMSSGRG